MTSRVRRRGRPRHPDVLTPAEWRTVDAVRHGLSNRRIATLRGVSVDAVKFHVGNALHKLGMSSRRELARWRGRPADSAQQHRNERNTTMTDLSLGPIGQISRPMRDVAAAADWYGKTLRLPHLYTFGELAFFDCGGIRLMLSPPETGAESAPSLLYFKVDDINAAYDELTRRGVTFKGAPHLVHRHDSGVEEWMAFFTDPEDNLLAVMSLEGGS